MLPKNPSVQLNSKKIISITKILKIIFNFYKILKKIISITKSLKIISITIRKHVSHNTSLILTTKTINIVKIKNKIKKLKKKNIK